MDPKIIDALLKSQALSNMAPLLLLVAAWLCRELLGLWRGHKKFKADVEADRWKYLTAKVDALSTTLAENTVAAALLAERISGLNKLIDRIPSIAKDLNELGDKTRRMEREIKSLGQ